MTTGHPRARIARMDGSVLVDFANSNLHVVNYRLPVIDIVPREELATMQERIQSARRQYRNPDVLIQPSDLDRNGHGGDHLAADRGVTDLMLRSMRKN